MVLFSFCGHKGAGVLRVGPEGLFTCSRFWPGTASRGLCLMRRGRAWASATSFTSALSSDSVYVPGSIWPLLGLFLHLKTSDTGNNEKICRPLALLAMTRLVNESPFFGRGTFISAVRRPRRNPFSTTRSQLNQTFSYSFPLKLKHIFQSIV